MMLILSLLFMLLKLNLVPVSASSSWPIAKQHCKDKCGNVSVPYPFGIGAGCYYNKSFEIICNSSFNPHKPFLNQFHLEVMDISVDGLSTLTVGKLFQNICTRNETSSARKNDLRGSPYRFSLENNLVVKGCGANVVLKNSSGDIVAGCSSICTNTNSMNTTHCFGISCCQAAITQPGPRYLYDDKSLDFYEIELRHEKLSSSQTCNVVAGLLYIDSSSELSGKQLLNMTMFPTVLEWSIDYDKDSFSDHIRCHNHPSCGCKSYNGYQGNPYLPNGCQLVKECQKCKHGCVRNVTDDFREVYICEKRHWLNLASILGFSISIGSVMLVLAGYWLYILVKKIRKIRQKAKYFKRNGGLLLQKQISSRDGIVDKTKIFSVRELEKATNNFSEDRILGQGGQGTVYKGMLVDGSIVAIKKSMKVDSSQLEQFINEMVILSLVNHRSVVKLLGCCLETEVPLLVYEYIPNGTLHQHIHDPNEEFHITWKMRLQIAKESASALAYLHSSSSSPIYHRDIKSSNILLDEKYRVKVSDFGTSRAITIEQTHVTTCVQGTYGYLDPEYFQSNQFNEKSDVYSFGVVLVELITGKKPILPNESGGWISLASEFLYQMDNSCLFDMLDSRISKEAKEQELIDVANLAGQCLKMKGKERPTMKEVSMLLDRIGSPNVPSKPNESKSLVRMRQGLLSGRVNVSQMSKINQVSSSSGLSHVSSGEKSQATTPSHVHTDSLIREIGAVNDSDKWKTVQPANPPKGISYFSFGNSAIEGYSKHEEELSQKNISLPYGAVGSSSEQSDRGTNTNNELSQGLLGRRVNFAQMVKANQVSSSSGLSHVSSGGKSQAIVPSHAHTDSLIGEIGAVNNSDKWKTAQPTNPPKGISYFSFGNSSVESSSKHKEQLAQKNMFLPCTAVGSASKNSDYVTDTNNELSQGSLGGRVNFSQMVKVNQVSSSSELSYVNSGGKSHATIPSHVHTGSLIGEIGTSNVPDKLKTVQPELPDSSSSFGQFSAMVGGVRNTPSAAVKSLASTLGFAEKYGSAVKMTSEASFKVADKSESTSDSRFKQNEESKVSAILQFLYSGRNKGQE